MQSTKYSKVKRVLIEILFLNIGVALAKIIWGIISNTTSMIADGFHSFSDGASNIVGIIGIWISSKPADENHPYGHQKVETLSTIVIAFMLFFVAGRIALSAYDKILNPVVPSISFVNFAIMIITLIVNVFVVKYENKKGEELKSSILTSDAKHTQSDIYVSLSVVAGLISVKLGFTMVDPIISMFIAALIVKAGIEILKDGIDVLIDAQMLDTDEIYNIVMEFQEVIYCHKIRTRGKHDHIMVDLHIGINKDVTISDAHSIAHEIESKIMAELEGVHEVIAHVEPAKEKYRRV